MKLCLFISLGLARLVDLFDGWATSWCVTTWHATTWHTTWHLSLSTSCLVHLGDDRVAHCLEILLHGFELLLLGVLGCLEPLHGLVDLILDLLGLILGHCALELVLGDGVLHLVAVRFELVLGVNSLLGCVVLLSILLGFTHHAINVVLGQTTLVVGDGDVGLLARGTLVLRCHVENTIGVNVEGHLDLWHTTRSRRDAPELELAQQVVVLCAGALTLIHLDQHTRLVVGVGCEGL